MNEFAQWLNREMPNIGIAAWLILTTFVISVRVAWWRIFRQMDEEERERNRLHNDAR